MASKAQKGSVYNTSLGNISVLMGDDIWQNPIKDLHSITINPYNSTANLETKSGSYFERLQLQTDCPSDLTLESCFIEKLSSLPYSDQKLALSLFMRGKLWDTTFKGRTLINYRNQLISGFEIEGASIISIGIP